MKFAFSSNKELCDIGNLLDKGGEKVEFGIRSR